MVSTFYARSDSFEQVRIKDDPANGRVCRSVVPICDFGLRLCRGAGIVQSHGGLHSSVRLLSFKLGACIIVTQGIFTTRRQRFEELKVNGYKS